MNIYVGDSINHINLNDTNVIISDDLLYYLYEINKKISFDLSILLVDPYDDVEISKNDIAAIVEVCNYITDKDLLQDFKNQERGYQMIEAVKKLAQIAIEQGKGLVSIGD